MNIEIAQVRGALYSFYMEKLWIYFAPCSTVSIIHFEHVFAG